MKKQIKQSRRNAHGDAVLAEMDAIMREHGSLLRPVDVVEYARNPETALHECFEWDDGKAAEKFRLFQARQLIRVRIRLQGASVQKIRAFVSLTPDRKVAGGGYRAIESVVAIEAYWQQLRNDVRREYLIFKRKFEVLPEWRAVFATADAVLAEYGKVDDLRKAGPAAN